VNPLKQEASTPGPWTYSPMCADQSFAIRLLREAVMTANAAIVLDGRV
jgi:hypothetical protein